MIDRREFFMVMTAAAMTRMNHENLYPIGLGTWQTFDVSDAKPLAPVLSTFVQLGGQVIDSSPMYGRSESVVGELATSLGIRDKLFIATKVWTSGRAAGIRQMEESERKLRGKVDLMQVLNFVISHPAVTVAIPATSRVEHLRQNMNAGRGVMPDAAMRKKIADAV